MYNTSDINMKDQIINNTIKDTRETTNHNKFNTNEI